jgi:hypothetical protein
MNCKSNKRINLLNLCIGISLLTAAVFLFLSREKKDSFSGEGFLFLFVIGTVLSIIASVISLRSKNFLRGAIAILLIFFLSILLILFAPYTLQRALSYIYTPPALTSKNVRVYNRCIRFVKSYDEFKNLRWWRGLLYAGVRVYSPHDFLLNEKIQKDSFADNMDETETLFKQLYIVKCAEFERYDDMVLFYKAIYVLPTGPGVLYSLSGKNPNEINSNVLNTAKPFIKINGNWYMSRHLMLRRPRINSLVSIPKSLIDHSLRIDGIDPNELNRFD